MVGMEPAMKQGKSVDQYHAEECSKKCGQGNPGNFTEASTGDREKPIWKENDSKNAAQGCATRDAEHLRACKGIAEQSLQDAAASRHPATNRNAQQDTRQARAQEDLGVCIAGKQMRQSL